MEVSCEGISLWNQQAVLKLAFSIQNLFKECPVLLCKFEMQLFGDFYILLFTSLNLGVYTDICLPLSWEEGNGPVYHLNNFILCGINTANCRPRAL